MRVSRPLGSGETLPADDFTRLGGGKAANRAFLARRLGLESWLFGRVGSDELAGQALAPLHRAGVNLDGFAAIKLKDGGCMLWADGQTTHIPPAEVTVVDTTGAGDAFTGTFATALLEGQTPGRATLLATAASHLAVTKWGSQPAYPTRAEILEFAHRLTQSHRQRASPSRLAQ